MFNLFKKNEPIKAIIIQSSKFASKIDYISPTIEEKEIVLFLLLIYTRIYRNCCSYFKTYKNDLNNSFKDIPKGSSLQSINYEFVTSSLIDLYNMTDSKDKPTNFNLQKGKSGYSIFVGNMSTVNPNLYFHCSSLLFLDKIKNKERYLDCLIDLATELNNKSISMNQGVEIPRNIIAKNFK